MSHPESSLDAKGNPCPAPASPDTPGAWRPLRAWIPLILLPLMLAVRFVPGMVQDAPSFIWMASAFGPFLIGLLVMLWWLLLSRGRWFERLLGAAGIAGAVAIEQAVCDESMRGPMPIVMTIPMTIASFAIGCIVFGRRLSIDRTWIAIGLAAVAAMFSTLIRTDGARGDFSFGFDWRWNPTAEQRAMREIRQAARKPLPDEEQARAAVDRLRSPEWPGFRGPEGASRQTGLRFSDDWSANPPQEMWRSRLGPAWSSFAVAGDRLFTQEQREDDEAVVCYDANSGKPVWDFLTPSRFFESLAGLGPEGTDPRQRLPLRFGAAGRGDATKTGRRSCWPIRA